MTSIPDFSFETACLARGLLSVAGVDEVGRGPLAGPVTAAAVVLDPDCIPEGLNDSKVLSGKRREELCAILRECAMVSVAHAEVHEIDRLNIHHASLLAMKRAIAGLAMAPQHLLIDGKFAPRDLACTAEALVGGDGRCLSIAAASIVAKITRDKLMVDLAQQYPGYGWETNMGYPSPAHRQALRDLGVTPHHRRSFAPVHHILYQEKCISD